MDYSDEHSSEEAEYQTPDDVMPRAMDHYTVYNYKKEEPYKKRGPVGRSANVPGRLRRVVSCKRKTHHLTVARRKQPIPPGRTMDLSNKENQMACAAAEQEVFQMDPWEFPTHVSTYRTGRTGSKPHNDFFTELSRDHLSMTNVLFGRNLRLKVALTLWRRNVGELLTYLLRIQDTGVFVDFLPVITKSINEDSPNISIGCCVDLFPLVKNVLSNPYEEYLTVGLKWIQSVLKNWWEELRASGWTGAANHPFDRNFQVFNQQLLEVWRRSPALSSAPGPAGDMGKEISSFLSQLT
ncbi:KATNB1-like protein 1 [Aplochiton taeniatus]